MKATYFFLQLTMTLDCKIVQYRFGKSKIYF